MTSTSVSTYALLVTCLTNDLISKTSMSTYIGERLTKEDEAKVVRHSSQLSFTTAHGALCTHPICS
jgi:hypothetical protein